jgi:hypothetical protein
MVKPGGAKLLDELPAGRLSSINVRKFDLSGQILSIVLNLHASDELQPVEHGKRTPTRIGPCYTENAPGGYSANPLRGFS